MKMTRRSPKKKFNNRPVTANAVLVRQGKVFLIKRRREPYKDDWAIPGGFVEREETTRQACLRELKEEIGILGRVTELIGVYDDPERDLRHSVNIAYLVKPRDKIETKRGKEAVDGQWFSLAELPPLAFDHAKILRDVVKLLNQ